MLAGIHACDTYIYTLTLAGICACDTYIYKLIQRYTIISTWNDFKIYSELYYFYLTYQTRFYILGIILLCFIRDNG